MPPEFDMVARPPAEPPTRTTLGFSSPLAGQTPVMLSRLYAAPPSGPTVYRSVPEPPPGPQLGGAARRLTPPRTPGRDRSRSPPQLPHLAPLEAPSPPSLSALAIRELPLLDNSTAIRGEVNNHFVEWCSSLRGATMLEAAPTPQFPRPPPMPPSSRPLPPHAGPQRGALALVADQRAWDQPPQPPQPEPRGTATPYPGGPPRPPSLNTPGSWLLPGVPGSDFGDAGATAGSAASSSNAPRRRPPLNPGDTIY